MDSQEFVYLVGIVPGPPIPYVKIGYARDVWSRLGELQCGNPFELRVLSFLPGGREVEGSIHCALAAHRVRGEWFNLGNDPLKMFMDAYQGRPVMLPRITKMPVPRQSAQAEKRAFDLFFDLRQGDDHPSQNAFERAWRKAGYGLKTDDIRALYKDIHTKVTGQ
ncbi:GIY-YIG nuclease family protein [Streptomyces sp. Wb2n-11]|uniref:GIY-YIG nuclease family protein n=1 Tax=Streptomyces sp. Wb2n-11 TaxID=1030533 RepID=UPI000ABA867A|nr:GIY-YIG nuclease family protein [Streptomyces sp. Wb2n-11]